MIACDIGLKRIGLATCKEGIILPIPAIIRINRNQAAQELDSILKERNTKILIVGLPGDGESELEGTRLRIKHFVSLLKFGGDVCFINEDFTSVEALKSLHYMNKDKRAKAQKDGKIDSISACIILERYLQTKT